MSIWVEYWKTIDKRWKNPAQIRERAKYIPPDPKHIHKRFFSNREEAYQFSSRMFDAGFHTVVKTDGGS